VLAASIIKATHQPDDEGSKYLWNASNLLWDYTVQQPRRQSSSFSSVTTSPLDSLFFIINRTCGLPLFHKLRYTQLCENLWFCEFINTPVNALSVGFFPMKNSTMNTRCWNVNFTTTEKNEVWETNRCGPCKTSPLTTYYQEWHFSYQQDKDWPPEKQSVHSRCCEVSSPTEHCALGDLYKPQSSSPYNILNCSFTSFFFDSNIFLTTLF
jgi:hypothetical protein